MKKRKTELELSLIDQQQKMKEKILKKTKISSNTIIKEMPVEYTFNYSKSKPNRFASLSMVL
ncbi:MAG: hypothetical protein FD143_1503 [Ignavibacteria bacterium]|nr:MAG: hypothetical protein FD143_1503 [Ignavibacteria bacterium]KAF0161899.1 MAG: hypothetical protein FD188_493 [Ignavibacteria bacterium]